MNESKLLSLDKKIRMRSILDESWKIFKSKFIHGRHPVLKEAPFQHHFANIISSVGGLYCIERADSFFVDLETKCENIKNKSKYLDITCSFSNSDVKCAIELKFKTEKQGAQDFGRIDAYVDIEALEHACKHAGYTFGKFYIITDSSVYTKESKRGVGTQFPMHNEFESPINHAFSYPSCKGRENVEVRLDHSYRFKWEKIRDWYFWI
ncbi:MAG TPA: hypothetical protein PKA82_13645 [Pyrinomonadaceae bacterium]|nr:hypothetical protein [Pyrinomonadaceae bacterium]